MAKARSNPLGLHVAADPGVAVVLVGDHGKKTHLYNPHTRMHACRSGINAGRGGPSGAKPKIYESRSRTITCYRCAKLATFNKASYGSMVPR